MEFRARISRIRMKDGADVRVLKTREDGEDWRGTIVRNARTIAEYATEACPLVGYVQVGLFGDGATSVGFRYDPVKCPVPRALIPAWLAEVVRRDMVSAVEAESVFNDMFEWREGL